MPTKPTTFDECLATFGPEQRAALEKLRLVVHKTAPGAVECVSYGLPAFKLDGRGLIAFGGWKNHCALYPMSGQVLAQLANELAKYEVEKGTIRFPPSKPLPAAMVRKIVKIRTAEIAARNPKLAPSKRDPDVEAFLDAIKYPPRKAALERLRAIVLGADRSIAEGIKWKSPSFRTSDWFATINTHGPRSIRLILHFGAKVKSTAETGVAVPDPKGLLKWLAKDRAIVEFTSLDEMEALAKPLAALVKAWIKRMPKDGEA